MINYRCPICGDVLTPVEKSLKCTKHCYDVAKEGYVNFLSSSDKHSITPGDNKDMVVSRRIIMESGYYLPLTNYITQNFDFKDKTVLDIGCGEGFIARNLSKFAREVFGIDISKEAVKLSAKSDKSSSFSVASMTHLPFFDHSFDFAVSAFAPYNAKETKRILKKDGTFIVAVPAEEHLFELKKRLYETPILNPKDETEIDGFRLLKRERIDGNFVTDGKGAVTLLKMTPYFYRTNKSAIEALTDIESISVNLSFSVSAFKPAD